METRITSHCRIKNHKIIKDGQILLQAEQPDFNSFSKKAYQHFKLNYLKFFKMDNLSKLAFINAELILRDANLKEKYQAEDIAVCISNSGSSMDTDRKYNESISDRTNYFPSPSVFVYTLPNILVGEICIRNNFKGDNSFFIFEKFDAAFAVSHCKQLMKNKKCQACVLGWIDFENEQEDSLLCLVEQSNDSSKLELTTENYANLYLNI